MLDQVLAFIVSAVFELKFYLLFSFLFGYSVTLQMQSAERAATDVLPRMLRRQAGLFAIGAVHAVLLFHGDILTTYAVLGLVLLAFRNCTDRSLLTLAAALLVATALLWLLIAWDQARLPAPDQAADPHALAAAIAAWRGTPMQIIGQHVASLADFAPLLLLLQAPCALAMFLIGFVAGRARLFERPDLYRPWRARAVLIGLLVGLPGGLLYAAATQWRPGTAIETASLALSILSAPFLTLAMLAALTALFDGGRLGRLRGALASAGRMALTNYLLQSLLAAMIFHGYGWGLIDRLRISWVLVLVPSIFAVQLRFSGWWLARFRYGPVEWLLRAITLWRWPDQRVPPSLSARQGT